MRGSQPFTQRTPVPDAPDDAPPAGHAGHAGHESAERPIATERPRRRWRKWLILTLIVVIVVPIAGFALWSWGTLHYTYSDGDRAGYVQKFSRKGWLCKTWEGDLAMTTFPGTAPQIFPFTVRDPAVANQIEHLMDRPVVLHYEQHIGVPTSCFGETEYYVVSVRPAG